MVTAVAHTKQAETAGPEDALAPGTTLLNKQYEIERYLSAGGFGITYLARDSLRRSVVIKECFPEAVCSRQQQTVCARSRAHQGDFKSFVSLFVREARSLSKLKHPNVVGVHQVFEDNETAYMALDLIEGDDLLSIIEAPDKRLNPQRVREILLGLLDAVALIHDEDMLHRDISPDNILINKDGNPILIDFGAAREEASKKSRALSSVLVVKDGYSPQEFYFGGSKQGPFSDLYALGATFYHLIAGHAPPHSQIRLSEIAANNPDPCVPLAGRFPEFDPSFLEAIDKAMSVFPKYRLQSARDWSNWIESKGYEAQSKTQSLVTEKTIKALIDKTEKPAIASRRQSDRASASPKYSLDLTDLRENGVRRLSLKRSATTGTRRLKRPARRPFARILSASVLLLVTLVASPIFDRSFAGIKVLPLKHIAAASTLSSQVTKGSQ